jgi:hypothetical protein
MVSRDLPSSQPAALRPPALQVRPLLCLMHAWQGPPSAVGHRPEEGETKLKGDEFGECTL